MEQHFGTPSAAAGGAAAKFMKFTMPAKNPSLKERRSDMCARAAAGGSGSTDRKSLAAPLGCGAAGAWFQMKSYIATAPA
jgi:hypothetical protein